MSNGVLAVTVRRLGALSVGIVMVLFVVMLQTAQAAGTITVNSQADTAANDGVCTLREAIVAANTDTVSGAAAGECAAGSGVDTIEFAITGTADFTNGGQDGYAIKLASALPNIDTQVTINGYTQPGAQVNTAVAPAPFNGVLLVELSGEDLPSEIAAQLNLVDGADSSVIRGLVINQSTGAGIFLNSGVDNIAVQGNYIGTDPTGLIDKGNHRSGITSDGDERWGDGPKNALIGGLDPEDRNIISANSSHSNDPNLVIGSQGIAVIEGADNWVVQGNYIGVGSNGTTDLGNELGGMTIDYVTGLTIGGSQTGATNVISGNGDGGLQPDGVLGFLIEGNYIGTDYTGGNPLPNSTKGMSVAYGSEDGVIKNNIIANHPWVGISIWQEETQKISVLGNSIYNHTGPGIDLLNQNDGAGVNVNDALDQDAGANDYLNYPENFRYAENGVTTDLTYTLDVPAGNYRVEFFSNDVINSSGHGEGKQFMVFDTITSSGSGVQSYEFELAGIGHTNITATVTEIDESSDGFGATSEFSSQAILEADTQLAKELLGLSDISPGGLLNYRLTFTNLGPSPFDLTPYASVFGSFPLFVDYVSPEMTPASRIEEGPIPGSYLVDAGNDDLACFEVGVENASGAFGFPNHPDYNAIACWYVGAETQLLADQSIVFTLDFELADDSDLVFSNAAFAMFANSDPDYDAINTIFGGGDVLDGLLENAQSQNPVNNFAIASYGQSQQPDPENGVGLPGVLPSVGLTSGAAVLGLASVLGAAAYLWRRQGLKKLR